MRRIVGLGGMLLALGVGCADETADPSATPEDPSGPVDPPVAPVEGECGLIDVSCPARRPHPGAPCQGALTCAYPEGSALWGATCVDEAWSLNATCTEQSIGGVCFLPSEAETCTDPFLGAGEGTVEAGVSSHQGAFRPFEEGELLEVEFGGQGSPMLWYRVQVDGPQPPPCARVTATMESPEFYEPGSVVRDVVLRCGASLDMFTIVPFGDCTGSTEPVEVTLTVEVEGIGASTTSVMLPADALCGGFG